MSDLVDIDTKTSKTSNTIRTNSVDISVNGLYFIVKYDGSRTSNVGESTCNKGDIVRAIIENKEWIFGKFSDGLCGWVPKTQLSLITDPKHVELLNEDFLQNSEELYKITMLRGDELDEQNESNKRNESHKRNEQNEQIGQNKQNEQNEQNEQKHNEQNEQNKKDDLIYLIDIDDLEKQHEQIYKNHWNHQKHQNNQVNQESVRQYETSLENYIKQQIESINFEEYEERILEIIGFGGTCTRIFTIPYIRSWQIDYNWCNYYYKDSEKIYWLTDQILAKIFDKLKFTETIHNRLSDNIYYVIEHSNKNNFIIKLKHYGFTK